MKHETNIEAAAPTVNVVNILRVADAIERAEVPGLGFDMQVPVIKTEPVCGTVACIAGWTEVVIGAVMPAYVESYDTSNACRRLGLSVQQAGKLFQPNGWRSGAYTSADAVRTLRHLAATGEVNWKL